jgi:hypothetical protein
MLRLYALAAMLAAAPAFAKDIVVEAGANAQERLQAALIEAKPGDTVRIGAGRFELTDGLSLDVNGVTVRGAGADRTVLSFKGQLGAGEGLLVTSDDVVLRDFAVEDSKGDGIKSKGADRIVYKTCPRRMDGRPQGDERRIRRLPGRERGHPDRRRHRQRRVRCRHLCRPVRPDHRPQLDRDIQCRRD